MASARDLLQKADTLMRTNRSVGAADTDEEVPLLTDVAVPGSSGVSYRQHRHDAPVLSGPITMMPGALPPSRARRDAPPAFANSTTFKTDTIFPLSQMPGMTVQGPVPDGGRAEPVFSLSAMEVPDVRVWDEGFSPQVAAGPVADETPAAAPAPAAIPAAAAAPAPARVEAAPVEAAPSAAEIAETVYYQVLQNLDLYTEQALRDHLTMHLAPIVERASHELLATLQANLGALMRQYVAQAIEKQLGVRPESSK